MHLFGPVLQTFRVTPARPGMSLAHIHYERRQVRVVPGWVNVQTCLIFNYFLSKAQPLTG